MTDDARPLAWRASARRVAWVGWLLGAAGGSLTVIAFALTGWGQSVQAGLTSDPASVVVGLLVGIPMGAPVGGAGGIWGAAIVVALRGRHPSQRSAERVVRAAAAAALLAVGVAAVAFLGVVEWVALLRATVLEVVVVVLGAIAVVWIVVLAARVDRADPATPSARPGRTPLVLGAALGPLAVIAAPLALALERPPGTSLTASSAGLLVVFGLGIGPLVGMAFAGIAAGPWDASDVWPRSQPRRVLVAFGVQVVAAAFLAFVGFLLLAYEEHAVRAAVVGGIVMLAVQLALLVAAWRSHARHAEDLSRSR